MRNEPPTLDIDTINRAIRARYEAREARRLRLTPIAFEALRRWQKGAGFAMIFGFDV